MAVDPPTCPPVPAPAPALSLDLPGGVSITSVPSATAGIITELNQIQSLMAGMGPALAGLTPVLKILDALFALFDTVGAAAEIPVDPTGFFEALAVLAEKMAALAPLVPQLSIPATIFSSLGAIKAFLVAIRSSVAEVAAMQVDAQALLDQAIAANDPELTAAAQCQLDTAAALAEHALAAMGPLDNIMGLVGGLLDIVPVGFELPSLSLSDLAGSGPAELLEALDAIIAAFDALPLG